MVRIRASIVCSWLAASSLGACSIELFHTSSWPDACDSNPNTPGCPATDLDAAPAHDQSAWDGDGQGGEHPTDAAGTFETSSEAGVDSIPPPEAG
jgi:hypothetical protein